MQTATNPQTGEKLVLQNGQWVPAGSAQPSGGLPRGAMTFGTPRPRLPSPQTPDQAEGVVLNNQQTRTSIANTSFDNADKLRTEFQGLSQVKSYTDAANSLSGALQAPDTGQGDLQVVYAFAKIMDPGSVVREGEMEMANQTASIIQDIERQYGKISDGNRLPREVRQGLLESARAKMRALNAGYGQTYQHYRDLASQHGFNPEQVTGPFAGDTVRPVEEQYIRAAGGIPRHQDGTPVDGSAPQPPVGQNQQTNPLYAELEREYRAQGVEVDYDADGKPIPVLRGASVGAPETNAFLNGVGDVVEGALDIPGLVTNPVNAGINWAFGTNLGTDLGQAGRDALGLPDNGDPMASAINQAGTTALTGAGLARGLSGLLTGPVSSEVANTVAAQPLQQGIGGAGAGGGTEFARQRGAGPVGQAAAGLAGGAGAFGGTNALMGLASRVGAPQGPLGQIAQRQGVDLLPADVGGPVSKRVTGAAAQAPFSATPIIKGATKAQQQLGAAAARAAAREGNILPIDEAGEAVQQAGLNYAPKQGAKIGRVYDRAEDRAKGVKIKPVGAVQLLDDQISRLSQTGNMGAPLVKDLQAIRQSIANGVSVSGMRDVRTLLSQGTFNGKIRSSMEKGIYKQVISAVSQDIENGLRAAGRKDALNLFKIADKAWSERIDRIDSILEPVLGNGKSGEDVLAAVERMAQGKSGGVKRLTGLLAEMPQEEAANLRATIVDRLGRATAGQQDDTGSKFSANSFLTRWNGMSAKGKASLFGNGELRQNLDEIAKLADATAQTGKYANTSNTVGGIVSNAGILASVGYNSPKAAAIGAIVQFATGQLMASRAFTNWLARMPANPAAQTRYAEKLGQIAAAEPIIANDIASVQNFLNGGSYRAAASPENQAQDRR